MFDFGSMFGSLSPGALDSLAGNLAGAGLAPPAANIGSAIGAASLPGAAGGLGFMGGGPSPGLDAGLAQALDMSGEFKGLQPMAAGGGDPMAAAQRMMGQLQQPKPQQPMQYFNPPSVGNATPAAVQQMLSKIATAPGGLGSFL